MDSTTPTPPPPARPGRIPRPPGRPQPALIGLSLDRLKAERDRVAGLASARKPPITRVLPVPRLVRIAGGDWVAHELRLRDLAELQAYLEDSTPHPLAGLPPAWADPEPETRPGRLAAAWEAAASWPPRLFTPAAGPLLGDAGGRGMILWLALRESHPGLGIAGAADLAGEASPAEWAALSRVAWGTTPREELGDELGPDRSPGAGVDWCRAFDQLLEHRGLTYQQAGDLYLSQWRVIASSGKAAEFTEAFGLMCSRVTRALGRLTRGEPR